MTKLLIAPHDDDAELFAAFTCLRERPVVVVCTDAIVQWERGLPVTAELRHTESRAALAELFVHPIFLGIPDTATFFDMYKQACAEFEKLKAGNRIESVWAPMFAYRGHDHHNAIALAASVVFGLQMKERYLTYANGAKQRDGKKSMPAEGDWISRKLRALSHHRSQMNLDPRMGCWPHFMGDLEEFYGR